MPKLETETEALRGEKLSFQSSGQVAGRQGWCRTKPVKAAMLGRLLQGEEFPGGPEDKDSPLSLLWLWFNPWSRNFCLLWAWPMKERKKLRGDRKAHSVHSNDYKHTIHLNSLESSRKTPFTILPNIVMK